MKYIIKEIQKVSEDQVNPLPDEIAQDKYQAEQIYHNKLSYAAVSQIMVHSVIMITDEGQFVKSEMYRHGEENDQNTEIDQ